MAAAGKGAISLARAASGAQSTSINNRHADRAGCASRLRPASGKSSAVRSRDKSPSHE
jgi:hypothetical protein